MGTPVNNKGGAYLTSEEQNIDLAKLIFIRVWYVYADPINWIKTKYKLRIQLIVSQQINF